MEDLKEFLELNRGGASSRTNPEVTGASLEADAPAPRVVFVESSPGNEMSLLDPNGGWPLPLHIPRNGFEVEVIPVRSEA